MVVALSKKSGKGTSDRQVSELSAFYTIKPGHAEQLDAAIQRFGHVTDNLDPKKRLQIGLRELRFVIFDNAQRLLFSVSFETDWDPYIDDGIAFIGLEPYVDWLQHLVEYPYSDDGITTATNAEVKQMLQQYQVPATWFHDVLAGKMMTEYIKANNVEHAFEQVLANPGAAEALQHPAMKPLLEQAAD
jgi:hypothetical protein